MQAVKRSEQINYPKMIVFTLRHHFLKSKTKEPPKFLSPSGIRGSKFISVYNFTAQFSVFISHVIKTKNHNRSINKFKNLGYDR